jgi:hypothetical protein
MVEPPKLLIIKPESFNYSIFPNHFIQENLLLTIARQ